MVYAFFRRYRRIFLGALALLGLGLVAVPRELSAKPRKLSQVCESYAEIANYSGRAIRRRAANVALYPPRAVAGFVLDTSRAVGKWYEDTVAARGPWRKLLRQFLARREKPGRTGILDFFRDPITSPLQTRLVRRGIIDPIGRTLGRREPVPPLSWTLAGPVGFVVSGGALYLAIINPFEIVTDMPNRDVLSELRERRDLIGFKAFDPWYRSGHFPSHAEAHSLYVDHHKTLEKWREGQLVFLPGNLDYLRAGLFGELSAAELAELLGVIKKLNTKPNAAEIERLFQPLSARLKESLKEFVKFDNGLRALVNRVIAAHKPPADLDALLDVELETWLEKHPRFGKEGGLPADYRLLLGEALSPRIEVEGKNHIEWLARLALAEKQETKEALRDSFTAIWSAYRGMKEGDRPPLFAEFWAVSMALKAEASEREGRDFRAERFARARQIDSFCEDEDCEAQSDTLRRPDIPLFRDEAEYFANGKERELSSEMDYWELMFHDVRFIQFALRKHRRETSDFDLLYDFAREAAAHSELNRLQAQIFADAEKAGQPDWRKVWRETEKLAIPKPTMAGFCSLLGYGKAPKTPNLLFVRFRPELDKLRTKLKKTDFNECRAQVAAAVWDYYAMGSEIADSLPEQGVAEARDEARRRMAEHVNAGLRAVEDILDSCGNSHEEAPPTEVHGQLDCEAQR